MRVLLIEDDFEIAEVIRRGLEQSRYAVDTAENGREGLELAEARRYDLILLDVMLPLLDGWQVCETLRNRRDMTPILMLTARDGLKDKVRGLDLGADDYLPKPFEFPELMARVRALLRRDKANRSRVIRVADLEIDTATRRVMRAGQETALTDREYTLLEALAMREGQTLTREVIQESVWAEDDAYSNVVDVYIRSLRNKLDRAPLPKLIHTVHGLGYTLRAPHPEDEP